MKRIFIALVVFLLFLENYAFARQKNETFPINSQESSLKTKDGRLSREQLIAVLINKEVHANYIPIASHRAQIMGSNLPENSLSAIKLAGSHDEVEIVELDIKVTKDGIPYLMHDNYLQRTTNFVDTSIGDYGSTYYGQSLSLYDWNYIDRLFLKNIDSTYSNERIPTFEEVLIYVKEHTEMLINLDINDSEVFSKVWDVVKKHDAFEICIFKGRYTYEEFKSKYYDTLSAAQKEKLLYFPIIPASTQQEPGKSFDFYNSWESKTPQIANGYELGYRKDPEGASFLTEADFLKVVSAIRQKNRVRVHVFSAMPDNYLGRFKGNVNIDQCCDATFDSRGDVEYLLDPKAEGNMESGANGYIITDDPVTLHNYLLNLGKRVF